MLYLHASNMLYVNIYYPDLRVQKCEMITRDGVVMYPLDPYTGCEFRAFVKVNETQD